MNFNLHGSPNKGIRHGVIDIQLVACASQYTLFDKSQIGAEDTCEWDKQGLLNYTSNAFYFKIYHN